MLQLIEETVSIANDNILNHSKAHPETHGMGTTIVMAWMINGKAYICWCGDSRCYVYNDNSGLIQLTRDHSYVQELVDKGELSAELMHDHPLSNVITRCLGDVDNRANPETRIYQLHNDDIIMLCSDGLCGICHDDQILDVMIKFNEDPIECKNELISLALSAGGYDNVTVALCTIEMEEEAADNDEEATNNDEESKKTEEEEELSTTIRSGIAVPHKKKRILPRLLLILLLILIAAGIYFYYTLGYETLKETISATIRSIINKIH